MYRRNAVKETDNFPGVPRQGLPREGDAGSPHLRVGGRKWQLYGPSPRRLPDGKPQFIYRDPPTSTAVEDLSHHIRRVGTRARRQECR